MTRAPRLAPLAFLLVACCAVAARADEPASPPAPSAEAADDAAADDAAADAAADDVAAAPAAPAPPPPLDDEPPAAGFAPSPSGGLSELMVPFAKTMLMLGVVLLIAYLTLSKGLGKLVERSQAGKRVKVVERVALDARRTLYLVDVDGRQMLLGGGEGGVVHITDTATTAGPATPAAPAPAGAPTLRRFAEALAGNRAAKPPVTTSGIERSGSERSGSEKEQA